MQKHVIVSLKRTKTAVGLCGTGYAIYPNQYTICLTDTKSKKLKHSTKDNTDSHKKGLCFISDKKWLSKACDGIERTH